MFGISYLLPVLLLLLRKVIVHGASDGFTTSGKMGGQNGGSRKLRLFNLGVQDLVDFWAFCLPPMIEAGLSTWGMCLDFVNEPRKQHLERIEGAVFLLLDTVVFGILICQPAFYLLIERK